MKNTIKNTARKVWDLDEQFIILEEIAPSGDGMAYYNIRAIYVPAKKFMYIAYEGCCVRNINNLNAILSAFEITDIPKNKEYIENSGWYISFKEAKKYSSILKGCMKDYWFRNRLVTELHIDFEVQYNGTLGLGINKELVIGKILNK